MFQTIVDYEISEIYRSSYLRSLMWIADVDQLRIESLSLFAQIACPIDVDLWKVEPQQKPSWWISVKPSSSIDTTPSQVWEWVSQLWEDQRGTKDGWIIGQSSGAIKDDENFYDFEIYGWLQRSFGLVQPTNEELADIRVTPKSRLSKEKG
jgi:hypothetical protein